MLIAQKADRNLIVCSLSLLLMVACGGDPKISYSENVKAILDQNCLECHQIGGTGLDASGFSMTTYGDLMKGTTAGPMVIAGDPEGSNLLVLMEGRADPSISMPHGDQKPVSKQDIQIIRQWIEQGAKNN
jgi:mono/diheme cytochrome c family protein